MPATRKTYHHGALRETLLAACLRLIDEEGIGAVSLRKVARAAGVSPGAPYHHFTDRAELLAALCVRGFELLGAELAAARAAEPDPLRALTALADAYLGFARANPARFRLMFRPELFELDKHPDAATAGDCAYQVVTDTIADAVRAGALRAEDAATIGVTYWALGHGLASLWLDGQLPQRAAELGTSPEALTSRVTTLVERLMSAR